VGQYRRCLCRWDGYGIHKEEAPAVADEADQISVEDLPFCEGIAYVSITFDQDVVVTLDDVTVRSRKTINYPICASVILSAAKNLP